ncbi:hypothetical protein HYDPIDRAFT_40373 [Hydnomerulius pinastri MD-312]|uniref:Histone H1 n=1 Tax=Hydnomerulius pinastri MD-312 TaxID=994086 RepID=A0A0C9WG15_9AGAM|nr:hypothetical protein HYDPIDRAFT_40373 [Hydnomerulius pinastri MD-312]
MQTTSAPAPYPPALPHVQNGYQPLSESEIYAIKKQYLGLLPPPQIIDICLTFEAHAPIHVKSSVWPYDIRAAIASIQAQKSQAPQPQTTLELEPSSKPSGPEQEDPSHEKATEPEAGTSQQSTSTPSPPAASASSSSALPPVAQPPTSHSHVPPTTPLPHYPHQPYYHPTYPHAPYYAPPHSAYSYPHAYPSYPQPPPAPYPSNPQTHPPPLFTNAPLSHPPHPAPEQHPPPPPPPINSVDDLPSYEEMIVEALIDSGDPEGCAPKNLFSWMAMHYPLQTNFRPSASQALQKAFKRGRLEKGSNGKYRLNGNWEGGNTSRRTTRRPQTLAQTSLPGPSAASSSSSPFTHTPLVAHGVAGSQTRPPPPGQPPGYAGYPFGYPYQGLSHLSQVPPSAGGPSGASQKQAVDNADHEIGEGSDAWEAAQNILKAINFGQLFQISNDDDTTGDSGAAGSSLDRQPAMSADVPDGQTWPASGESNFGEASGPPLAVGEPQVELNGEQRAALQAQLALLAAQLAELADVSEDELSHDLNMPDAGTSQHACSEEGPGSGDDDDEDEDMEMVEVPVPMASLTA